MTISELECKLNRFKMSEYYDKNLEVRFALEQIPLSNIDDPKTTKTYSISAVRFVKRSNQLELVSRV